MTSADRMKRLATAFVGVGMACLVALDFVYAPRLFAAEGGGGATTAGSAGADLAAPQTEPPKAASSSPALPAVARVPTIVARFESGSIEPADLSAIRLLATAMIENPDDRVVLEGHSDTRGAENFNHDLSLERANAVKDKLVLFGVTPSRIETVGLGATRPLRNTEDASAQAVNRRVELRWVGK